jgi:hypothetical protein
MANHPTTTQDPCDEGFQFEPMYVPDLQSSVHHTDCKNSIFHHYTHYLLLKPTKSSDTLLLCLCLYPILRSAHNPLSLLVCLEFSSLEWVRKKTCDVVRIYDLARSENG